MLKGVLKGVLRGVLKGVLKMEWCVTSSVRHGCIHHAAIPLIPLTPASIVKSTPLGPEAIRLFFPNPISSFPTAQKNFKISGENDPIPQNIYVSVIPSPPKSRV